MKKPQQIKLKLLVFPVNKLTLAIPVEDVKKVINLPKLYGSGLNYIFLSHGDNQEITVFDLHQKLFNLSAFSAISNLEEQETYLVIAQNTMNEEFGIIVTETPTIIDVPLSEVRMLPPSYRHSDTLEIASHVTVIPQENQENLTIFIIDCDQLLNEQLINLTFSA
jgi:purine-binding chemotaxis protein CheW